MLPFTGPAERTCPYCGEEEANAWLLSNNHWVPSQFVAERGICVAMDLTRNHVVHDVRRLAEARVEAAQQIQGRARKVAVRELEQATAALKPVRDPRSRGLGRFHLTFRRPHRRGRR